jgi:hypothetical protein
MLNTTASAPVNPAFSVGRVRRFWYMQAGRRRSFLSRLPLRPLESDPATDRKMQGVYLTSSGEHAEPYGSGVDRWLFLVRHTRKMPEPSEPMTQPPVSTDTDPRCRARTEWPPHEFECLTHGRLPHTGRALRESVILADRAYGRVHNGVACFYDASCQPLTATSVKYCRSQGTNTSGTSPRITIVY